MALIVYPTIVGGLSATIGVLILPYVHMITTGIGNMVNSFTELQPVCVCLFLWSLVLLLFHHYQQLR